MTRRYKTWTTSEMRYIVEHLSSMTISEIAENLGRSRNSVVGFLRKHNIRSKNHWTREELQIMRDVYGRVSVKELVGLLPMHSIEGIFTMANRMGLTNKKGVK